MTSQATINPIPFPAPRESCDLVGELIATYGSPLYVYDGDRLRQTIHHITQAFPYPRTRFHFASVTNGNIALLQLFRQSGWGIHANTPGDIYLARSAGFSPEQIVYTGSNLNPAEMEQVLRWGVRSLNLDSLSQLELACQIWRSLSPDLPGDALDSLHLGLRLNYPDLTGDSRIGVRPAEFPDAVEIARSVGLSLEGVHFYRGTGTNATSAFTEAIATVLDIAQQLPDWRYLDFGGGFGYPYHHDGVAFDWQEFGQALSDRLSQLNRPIQLIIEPGRAAIAGCGTLLTTIVSAKWQEDKQILGTDTTVANLSVPVVHGGYREMVPCDAKTPPATERETHPTDVCGNTTYSRDYLGRNYLLPELQPGDRLAILDVGAYGYAMSSHFLHRPLPAEVLVEHQQHRLIRQREDYSVLLENQVF